jgi:hypothetical protein
MFHLKTFGLIDFNLFFQKTTVFLMFFAVSFHNFRFVCYNSFLHHIFGIVVVMMMLVFMLFVWVMMMLVFMLVMFFVWFVYIWRCNSHWGLLLFIGCYKGSSGFPLLDYYLGLVSCFCTIFGLVSPLDFVSAMMVIFIFLSVTCCDCAWSVTFSYLNSLWSTITSWFIFLASWAS